MIVGKAPCCGAGVRLDMGRLDEPPPWEAPDAVACDSCEETFFLWRDAVPVAASAKLVMEVADIDADNHRLIFRDATASRDLLLKMFEMMDYEEEPEEFTPSKVSAEASLQEAHNDPEVMAALEMPPINAEALQNARDVAMANYLGEVRLRCAELAAPWSRRHGGSLDFFFIRADAFCKWTDGGEGRLRVLEIAVAAGIETEAHEATLARADKIWAWMEGE